LVVGGGEQYPDLPVLVCFSYGSDEGAGVKVPRRQLGGANRDVSISLLKSPMGCFLLYDYGKRPHANFLKDN
jgi:hypothetical protein